MNNKLSTALRPAAPDLVDHHTKRGFELPTYYAKLNLVLPSFFVRRYEWSEVTYGSTVPLC